MKKTLLGLFGLIVVGLWGCGNFSNVIGALGLNPTSITLRLVNETSFRVEPSVFVSAAVGDLFFEGLTEGALALDINRQGFSDLDSGQIVSQPYDCDDIKAVMAKDAELITGIGISPDEDSAVFIEDDDFECGDTITIRYSGGLANFDVTISASRGDPFLILDVLTGL